jgi:pimeloyl-ACP methyl ester carboxylesterase
MNGSCGFLGRKGNMPYACVVLIVWLSAFFSVAGCTFLRLSEEVKTWNASSVIAGTVSASSSLRETPVVVLAYSKSWNLRKVADYTLLHEPGPFEVIVPRGRYTIVAFCDINRNLVYDAGEPAGQYPVAISAGERALIRNLNVTLAEHGQAEVDFPRGAAAAANPPEIVHSTLPGALADLDDAHFSYENGKKGYWRPLSFFREIGCNIYFLDAYDPLKIPVLFVHGATGSPLGWRQFFDHMDLNRFQPWFYYYPSGASLQSMADILYSKLLNLQDRYCFDELIIVAHSMGGLIVRSVLVDHGRNLPFISIHFPVHALGRRSFGRGRCQILPSRDPGLERPPAWRRLRPFDLPQKTAARYRLLPSFRLQERPPFRLAGKRRGGGLDQSARSSLPVGSQNGSRL